MISVQPCFRLVIPCVVIVGLAAHASGQGGAPVSPKKPNPAFAPIKDDPSLPRVLLIGDSISVGYTIPVREALAGKANLHRIPVNAESTGIGLAHIDEWLADGRWDVIHFNWGLHDLRLIEGKHQVSLDRYADNLQKLVDRLKKTNAKLIWCTTTPVPKNVKGVARRSEDVAPYNEAAKKIMEQNGVEIDDLHAFALPRIKEIQLPADVHFSPTGSKVLAGQVAAAIEKALPKPAPAN